MRPAYGALIEAVGVLSVKRLGKAMRNFKSEAYNKTYNMYPEITRKKFIEELAGVVERPLGKIK